MSCQPVSTAIHLDVSARITLFQNPLHRLCSASEWSPCPAAVCSAALLACPVAGVVCSFSPWADPRHMHPLISSSSVDRHASQ